MFEGRLARLLRALARRRAGALVCARETNIRYLTGFSGSDALLFVSETGTVLVTDGRYAEQARAEARGTLVVVTDRKWEEIGRRIRREKARRVAVEARYLSAEAYRRLLRSAGDRLAAFPDPVAELRMRKDEAELRAIEEAAVAAGGALLFVLLSGIAGRSESEAAADIEREMKRLGASGPAFPPIVAAPPRSSLPHATPTEAPIGEKGPVVVDFGARRRGYCSDETVTLFPGKIDRAMQRAFDAVRRAQDAGIRAVRPGAACREVDARVRESLDRSGYLKYFVHSTGHGVGLDVHERPFLSPRSRDRLAEGMVVTVEPGVYLPGRGGIRLEDTVRVAGSRAERITYLPKDNSLPVQGTRCIRPRTSATD